MANELTNSLNAMNVTEKALKAYQDPNLSTNIQNLVQRQWTPQLTKSAEATQNMMADYVPRFFNIPYSGLNAGTTAADLTPQQKITSMANALGTMGGQLTASSNLTEALGGQMSNMQAKALQAAQMGQTAASDAYNRAFQRYQLALQQDEARKARAASAAAQAAALKAYNQGTGGGATSGGNLNDTVTIETGAKKGLEESLGTAAKMGLFGPLGIALPLAAEYGTYALTNPKAGGEAFAKSKTSKAINKGYNLLKKYI